MFGIRFLGMNISKPFVDVWSSFPIEKELKNIIEIAKKEFKVFKPKHIRFWSNPKSEISKQNQENICQNYLAGSIEKSTSFEKPINYQVID